MGIHTQDNIQLHFSQQIFLLRRVQTHHIEFYTMSHIYLLFQWRVYGTLLKLISFSTYRIVLRVSPIGKISQTELLKHAILKSLLIWELGLHHSLSKMGKSRFKIWILITTVILDDNVFLRYSYYSIGCMSI